MHAAPCSSSRPLHRGIPGPSPLCLINCTMLVSQRLMRLRAATSDGQPCEPCGLAGSPSPQVASPPATTAQAASSGDDVLRLLPGDDVLRLLPVPPNLRGKNPRSSWNATALAFLGDAVWEIYVRRKYFYPPTRMAAYYKSVVKSVRAESQAKLFYFLVEGSFLTAEERDVLRWGRNATGSSSPKRFAGADVPRDTYRAATALECLVGYLYLTDPARLHCLMEQLGMDDT